MDFRDLLDARRWTREQADSLVALLERARRAGPITAPLHTAVATWASQPSAPTPLFGSPAGARALPADLTRYSEARITAAVTVPGAATARLGLFCAPSAPTVLASYRALGADASIATAGVADSGWHPIQQAERGHRFIEPWGFSGNGTASPSIGVVVLWLR